MALPFSNTDKIKYMTGQYKKEIKLYFPEMPMAILNDEIYSESLSLEEAIFDGNGELSIIGCISNRFSIEIRKQGIQLKNKKIEVEIKIDNGSWNRIFTGYVDSVETVKDRSYQKLQCFDILYKYQNINFYSEYEQLTFPVSISTLRHAIFDFIGIDEVSTVLVNDSIYIGQTITNGELNVLDAIRAICQMNGVFGRINAEGEFQYYTLTLPDDIETIYIDKYKNISYEDYAIKAITGVTVRDNSNDSEYGNYGTDENTLLIEGNIWCRGLEQIVKDEIAENIYDTVKDIEYQPFNAKSIGLPYVECGDAVSYYVYDYSSGVPVTEIMNFSVLTRHLSGIQWLEDTYTANGSEYQPEVKFGGSGEESQKIESLNNEVNDLSQKIDDLGNKQNYIEEDNLLPPASGGTEGDLKYYSTYGANFKRLYRYEDNQWVRVLPFDYGSQPSGISVEEGDLYIENDGVAITRIMQYINGQWLEFSGGASVTYGRTDLTPGVSPLATGRLYLVYE